MEDWLYTATTVFLIGGWVVVELFVRRKAQRGTVLRGVTHGDGLSDWLEGRFLIRTDDGRTVVARASGCVQCQGDLRPGRRVGLLRDQDGFVVARTEGIAAPATCARGRL